SGRLKQILHRWHRSVMKIWRRKPHAFERLGNISFDLLEGLEAKVIAFSVVGVGIARPLCPHVAAVPVRPDFRERDDGESPFPLYAVALCAFSGEYDFTLPDKLRIRLTGRGRRGKLSEKLFHPADRNPVKGFCSCSVAEC